MSDVLIKGGMLVAFFAVMLGVGFYCRKKSTKFSLATTEKWLSKQKMQSKPKNKTKNSSNTAVLLLFTLRFISFLYGYVIRLIIGLMLLIQA